MSAPARHVEERNVVEPALGQSWALDRHVLPRIALAFISIASLSRVYLTMTTHGASPGMAVLRRVHLMSLGILAGGTMWWGFVIGRPEDREERGEVAPLPSRAAGAVSPHRAHRAGARASQLGSSPHGGGMGAERGSRSLAP